MSESEKDNNKFEFIKEQVIEKRHKKVRKLLFPTITTVGFAVLFGVTAAVTYSVAQPFFHKVLHKEDRTATPVCFPTECPQDVSGGNKAKVTATPTKEPVIVEKQIEASTADYLSMNEDIRKIADNVNKSIVNITSTFEVEDWFGKTVDRTVSTTGVIVFNNSKDFLVLVSLDRIKDAKKIEVVFADGVSVEADLQDYESEMNLALIAVPIDDIPSDYKNILQTATLGESFTISVGSPVIALGSPNGHAGSMEFGTITSKGSSVSITDDRLDLFNTDIEDNNSSDGIIVNLKGEVIGVITRTLKENINSVLNTVIGINQLKPIITAMGNKEPRVYFGVKTDDMTSDTKSEYDITNGIYVNDVQVKSPAFKAGMQSGDIILEVNEVSVTSSSDFYNLISNYQPDDKIKVKILRKNGSKQKNINLKVVLAKK